MVIASHYVYGLPPAGLVCVPDGAQQCSPLIPGAADLAELPAACADGVIVYAPPSTLERRAVLAQALRVLKPGAALTALAGRDKGGARIGAELAAFGCRAAETARQHHRILHTLRPETLLLQEDALAAAAVQVHPAHGLWTQPGIFSWDRIDAGSALLVQHLPALCGAGADFGCGMGVLSRAVLSAGPQVTSLLLTDIDRRAVAAARRNITDSRAQFLWADLRAGAHAAGLDFVVMNPPFHDAGNEDQALGQLFIRRAAEALRPGGVCWLVANRHLPYEALLRSLFGQVTPVAEAHGFKLYKAAM